MSFLCKVRMSFEMAAMVSESLDAISISSCSWHICLIYQSFCHNTHSVYTETLQKDILQMRVASCHKIYVHIEI